MSASATGQAAQRAWASRVRRPCLWIASARRRWSAVASEQSAHAVVVERCPTSTRAASSGASLRARRRRRSTQPRPWPTALPMASGVRPSSASERTMRASSMELAVRRGELAARMQAFCASPPTASTTTGTVVRPSAFHRESRLWPSRTSNTSSSTATTRNGNGARAALGSVREPRRGANEVRSAATGTSRTSGVTGASPPATGVGRAGSGRR